MESNPYLEARREWDERYADLVLGKRNWQIAAGGLLLLSLILASGVVRLGNHSRYIPYFVEVDKLGYALTVPQPLTPVACSCLRQSGEVGSNDGLRAPFSILALRTRRVAGLHKVEGLLVHQPLALRE